MSITREIIGGKIWASGAADPADKTEPGLAEILAGWPSGSKPPRQWFNWLDYVQHNNLAFFEQEGFYEWDTVVEYQQFGIVRGSDDVLYISKVDINQANDPSGGADTVNWQTFTEFLGIGTGTNLPLGTLVTGNILGMNCESNATLPNTRVDVKKGICNDGLDETELILPADVTVNINDDYPSPAINTLYSIFVTDSGEIHFDTSVSGATLTGAGAKVRWISFALTDNGGNIKTFRMINNSYGFYVPIGGVGGSVKTAFSLTSFVPVVRLKECTVTVQCNASGWYYIYDGDTTTRVAEFRRVTDDARLNAVVVPENNNVYLSGAGGAVHLSRVLLNR